jgi:transposase, IS5 family
VLLQESLSIAVKTEAIEVKDLSKVIVDTTVQEKAVTVPTDAKLLNRARVPRVNQDETAPGVG